MMKVLLVAGMVGALLPAAFAAPAAEPPAINVTGTLPLEEVGLYRVGYRLRDGQEKDFPVGWTGHFEEHSGISCTTHGTQNGKRTLLLHCPWRLGAGSTYQEFRLNLPAVKPLAFVFDTAMRTDVVGKSDGATFRAFVDGRKIYEEHRADATWKPFRYDLSDLAGKTVVLRLEVDAGPNGDPSFDYSYWGDPRVETPGASAALLPKMPATPPLKALTNHGRALIPSTAATKTLPPAREGNTFVLRSTAPDADLSFHYTPAPAFLEGLSGLMKVGDRSATFAPSTGAEVVLALDKEKTISARSPEVKAELLGARIEGDTVVSTHRYTHGNVSVTLRVRLALRGRTLQIDTEADRAGIASLAFGNLSAVPMRRIVTVPYLGTVVYVADPGLYHYGFLDWLASNGSRFEGTRAHYRPLTDGTRHPLKETCYLSYSPHLAEVLPNVQAAPSPYRQDLGPRVMLDIWGGRFADDAAWLEELASYGIRRASIIKHTWQRDGYDNGFPNFVPANKGQGGDEGMKQFVQTAVRLGHRVSLHENYVDFYQNSDIWNEDEVARDPQGQMVKAWFNRGTNIQSYATAPTAMMRHARMMSPQVHSRYGTNASYLDVHTCVPPWWRADYRAGVPGAGKMRTLIDTHRELFAFMRETHKGPFFGEGSNTGHWYWSGMFDGAEAQVAGGENTSLLVDFDLLKIKPLQLNHGMGYMERWWSSGYAPGWGSRLPTTAELDRYRMQEIAFGHQPFVAQQTWKTVPYVWREHHLATPVSARYATANPSWILYEVGGRMVPASSAIHAGVLDRVAIAYDNGLRIWANSRQENWRVGTGAETMTLPPDGWMARGAGVTAWTALLDGVIADYAETPESVFVDARTAVVRPTSQAKDIRLSAQEVKNLGNRRFAITYRWDVGQTLPDDYHCFIHFEPVGKDEILFQGDHRLPRPTSTWKAGETLVDGPHPVALPANLPDGDYHIGGGLYKGDRLKLRGPQDSGGRSDLGTLHVRANGAEITYTPPKEQVDSMAAYEARLNLGRKRLDFGPVITDGSVLVEKANGSGWNVTVYPRETAFTIGLRTNRLPGSKAGARYSVEAVGRDGKSLGAVKHTLTDGVLTWQAGVKDAVGYRVR